MIPTIRVAATTEELAWQVAERLASAAEGAVVATGRFVVALSGGSTPQTLYGVLAEHFAEKVPWEKTHILFADERCVPPDHPDSNFGMVCRLLLDRVGVDYQRVHRMAGEKDPAEAADEYQRLLEADFGRGLDLVLLGMGEDGHTASLFPDTQALQERERLCVANYVPKLSAWRLTLTAGYINRAFEVIAMVAGQAKAAVTEQALAGMGGPARLPIQLIQPEGGRFTWMMDAAAAGMDNPAEAEDSELGLDGDAGS